MTKQELKEYLQQEFDQWCDIYEENMDKWQELIEKGLKGELEPAELLLKEKVKENSSFALGAQTILIHIMNKLNELK